MNMTTRRSLICGVFLLAMARVPAAAQPLSKPYRIGILDWMPAASAGRMLPLQQALRDFGLIDGQNIAIDYRSAEEKSGRIDVLARDLVGDNVDILVAVTTPSAHAAMKATKTIPIVMTAADPVGTGLVPSLARPGGNITGMSTMLPDLASKRLELLRDIFPRLARVGFLGSTQDPAAALFLRETRAAAARFNIQVADVVIDESSELESAMTRLVQQGCDAVIVQPLFVTHRARLAEMALRLRVPLISDFPVFASTGSLLSYGPDTRDTFERLASYVDKIVKGAKPGDLPIEQPSTFRLVVNLKTARALGIEMPPAIIARADEVVE